MFSREVRQKHALFIRNKLTEAIPNLSGNVLDAEVVGDPELITKMKKLRDDTNDVVQYLNSKLDHKEA